MNKFLLMQCSDCLKINYKTKTNKENLILNKYCKHCNKKKIHKSTR